MYFSKFLICFLVFISSLIFSQTNDNKSLKANENLDLKQVHKINKLIDSARVSLYLSPAKSINFADSSYSLSKQIGYIKGLILSTQYLGIANRNIDNHSKALSYLFESLNLEKKHGTPFDIASAYNNVGLVYLVINDLHSAQKYFLNSLEIMEKYPDGKLLPNLYNNLGSLSQGKGENDSAIDYYNKALNIFETKNDSLGISKILNNFGYFYELIGENIKSLEYYEKSLKLKRKFGSPIDIANTLQNLASINISIHKPERAIDLLNESIRIAKTVDSPKLIADAYLLLAFTYYYKRDDVQSNKYKNLYSKISTEINQQDQSKKLAELHIKYQIDEQEQRNEYLTNLNNLQKYYILVIIIVFAIIVILLLNKNRAKKKSNQKLTETASQLQKRIEFIEFLSGASSKLINLSINQIDNQIIDSLKFITKFTNFSFSAVFIKQSESNECLLKHKWDDISLDYSGFGSFNLAELKEFYPLLENNHHVVINVVNILKYNDFKVIKSFLNSSQIKSFILIPLLIDNDFWGMIVVGSKDFLETVDDEVLSIYSLTGQIIANANNRKTKEENMVVYSKELEEINASKDKFYSMISHDLKSPLQGLLGLASYILSDIDSLTTEEIKEFVGNIENSAKNLFRLIENTLNWTRFETGRIQFEPELFNLYLLQDDIISVLDGFALKKNIRINLEIDKELRVNADKKMIYSVLSNLTSNAIKFTNIGGEINIEAQIVDNNLKVSVSDNGIGMSQEQISNLFNIKTVSSTPGTESEKGTGLGLLLCAEMIERHKGTLTVQSKENEGSKFTFTIPQ